MDRRLRAVLGVDHAALAGDGQQAAGEARLAAAAPPGRGDSVPISGFSEASMQVAEARRYSRRIGLRRCDSVNGTPGRCSASSSPTRISWAGLAIDQRRQTPTASIAQRREPGDDRAHGRFVERPHHLAGGADPLRDLEGEGARNVGARKGLAVVVGIEAAAFAQQQDVAMARGGQKGGARRRAGEDRIDGARGGVDESLDPGRGEPRRVASGSRRRQARSPPARRRPDRPAWSATCRAAARPPSATTRSVNVPPTSQASLSIAPPMRACLRRARGRIGPKRLVFGKVPQAPFPSSVRHGRACPGHPRLCFVSCLRAVPRSALWMAPLLCEGQDVGGLDKPDDDGREDGRVLANAYRGVIDTTRRGPSWACRRD